MSDGPLGGVAVLSEREREKREKRARKREKRHKKADRQRALFKRSTAHG